MLNYLIRLLYRLNKTVELTSDELPKTSVVSNKIFLARQSIGQCDVGSLTLTLYITYPGS